MKAVLRGLERIEALGPALREAGRNLWWSARQNSQDRRLWTGLGVSLLVHFLFFFFLPRPGEVEEYELTEVAYFDLSYSPKAAAVIPRTGIFQVQPVVEEVHPEEVVDLTRRVERTQAAIELERYHPAPEGIAEVIRIGRKGEGGGLTTEEILAQAPVQLRRAPSGVGGPPGLVGYPGMGVGPPIALETGPPLRPVAPQEIRRPEEAPPEIAPTPTGPAAQLVISEHLRERLLHRVLPRYPEWARRQGITNVVITLSLSVTPDGRVNPMVLVDRSSGYPIWDQEVCEALRGWRFRPLPSEHPQVDMWGQVTFIFRLM